MRRNWYSLSPLIFSLSATYADENSKERAIAKQNACLGCHVINNKIVGPGFQDVAKRYTKSQHAKLFLKNKILQGGSGSWGAVPMPANAKLNDADLNLLVSWILRGAPDAN